MKKLLISRRFFKFVDYESCGSAISDWSDYFEIRFSRAQRASDRFRA